MGTASIAMRKAGRTATLCCRNGRSHSKTPTYKTASMGTSITTTATTDTRTGSLIAR